jgi:asparagine synthase (glutamine-hydrolysing)
MLKPLAEVINLVVPETNRIHSPDLETARQWVLAGDAAKVRNIDGSFALLAREGTTVRMARSMDRPMRYFLAKRVDGPALVVAQRIDEIHQWLISQGLGEQFHPSYTRMVPAHFITEIQLVGCPDPDPVYTRFFDPKRDGLSTDLNEIGERYIAATADEIAKWLRAIPGDAPVGVSFSGGIDSGAIFVLTHHLMQKLGMNPSRLKAFTLTLGDGEDATQAHNFLQALGLSLFHEIIEVDPASIDLQEAVRIVEDYKPLDIQSAAMAIALFRGIRSRYPDWKYMLDGEGGDENLKDYPIEENPELTIRSVVNNLMLYQEGWGVGKIKHSLTYSGGLSRSYSRSYAPARLLGFEGLSPFTRPNVMEISEGIPFIELTKYDVPTLYSLKGEIVSRGIRALTGVNMPVYQKRRFQHGATRPEQMRRRLPDRENEYRRSFLSIYS